MENMKLDYYKLGRELNKIGKEILNVERLALSSLGRDVKELTFGGRYEDEYYKEVGANLWAGIPNGKAIDTYPHFKEYDGGSGGELLDKEKDGVITPAKMKSIRSSSAMTYNLLANSSIATKEKNGHFTATQYAVEYEKQLFTIRRNLNPANLDAYLYSEDAEEAIFCEMKMMEWMFNKPGRLKEAYEAEERYFAQVPGGEKAVQVFKKAICLLKEEMRKNGMDEQFFRYDAWQMFKHLLGIYNMTSDVTRAEVSTLCQKSNGKIKLIPQCKKITLVNVVFEPSEECLPKELREKYNEILDLEHSEFKIFESVMRESGIYQIFETDCHIQFEIKYMSATEFMKCFHLQEREDYLERYRLSKATYERN